MNHQQLPNTENEHTSPTPAQGELSGEELTGSWEEKGKSLTAAAITGLFIIGAVYFNVQSFLVTILTIIYQAIYNIELPPGLIEMFDKMAAELKAPILIGLVISQYFFMMAPSLWLVKKWHTSKIKKYLRIKRSSINEMILAVLITISALPFCYFISDLLMDSLNIPQEVRELGTQLFTASSFPELLVLILAIAVTPAICEEIFFRGYFQRTLERTTGWKSVLWTGFLFGLFHFQPLSLFVLSFLGILFSFFYFRSKSILPPALAHFTNNFIALFLLYSQAKEIDLGILSGDELPAMLVFLSTLLTAVLLWLYIKLTKNRLLNTSITV